MPTVLLVRHGRSIANAAGVLAGWAPDIVLDEVGREQARAVGERLRAAGMPLARLVSSPLERCVQTAQLMTEHLVGEHLVTEQRLGAGPAVAADHPATDQVPGSGAQVEVDERLGECRYGAWTGRALTELAAEPLWRIVQDQPSAAVFPDGELFAGESLAAMSARAVAAVRELDAQVGAVHGEQAVWLAVSHGDIIKAIVADALGMHLDQFQRIHIDPASVSVVTYTARRPVVGRVNDLGGPLAGLVPVGPATPRSAETDGALPGDATIGGGTGSVEGAGAVGPGVEG